MSERLGYIRINANEKPEKFKCDTSLSKHQEELLCEENNCVSEVFEIVEAFECFSLNLKDFKTSAEETVQEVQKRRAGILTTPDWILEQVTIFRQRLSNIVYSFTALLDITKRRLSSYFGKKSVQVSEFEDLLSAEFDNSFGYRFFYKLRNCASHHSLPDIDLYFLRIPENPASASKPELRLSISKAVLVNSNYKWGAILSQDFATEPDEIVVGEALRELAHSVVVIFTYFLRCFESQLQEAQKTLVLATFVAGAPGDAKPVIWDGTRVTPQDSDGCRMLKVAEFQYCWRQVESLRKD